MNYFLFAAALLILIDLVDLCSAAPQRICAAPEVIKKAQKKTPPDLSDDVFDSHCEGGSASAALDATLLFARLFKVSPVAEFFEGTFLVQFLFQTAEGAFDGFTFFQAHFCCFHCVSPPFDAVAKFIFILLLSSYSLVKLASSASRARSLVRA